MVAHVAFKNEAYPGGYDTEYTLYWSYAANPFWHVELRECVEPGHEVHADVVYKHIERGPQIKFSAELASTGFLCTLLRGGYRAIAFHKMDFTPDAELSRSVPKTPRQANKGNDVVRRGGGNDEVCDDK